MTLKELREKIAALPTTMDAYPVWLGVDSGEGWERAENVLVENAKFADLDGDEVSDEHHYIDPAGDKDSDIQGFTSTTIPAHYTFQEVEETGVISVYRDIVVLGNHRTVNTIEYNKDRYEAGRRWAEKKRKLAEEKVAAAQDPDFLVLQELQKKVKVKFPNIL